MKSNIRPELAGGDLFVSRSAKPLSGSCLLIRIVATVLLSVSFAAEGAILQKADVSSLKATTGMSDGDVALVEGYYSPGDRGGGKFKYVASSTKTDDGGRYIAPNSGTGRWARQLDGDTANVRMWGAKGDWHEWMDYTGANAHDDTANIQSALDACANGGLDSDANTYWTGELLFPSGHYKLSDTLVWSPWAVKLRGEKSELVMRVGIWKDILRGKNADQLLKGQHPSETSDLHVRLDDMFFRFQGWDTNEPANPTNACLVISEPQENNAIHNVFTDGGAYGIRCLGGGNGAPLAFRDICVSSATVAGVYVEPPPGSNYCGGHISISGITGDYFGTASASLVKFVNYKGIATIEDLNAEGRYNGGVIQHKFPDSASGLAYNNSAIGRLALRGCQYDGTTGYSSNHFLVLKGGQRTTAVTMQDLSLYVGGSLIRDEVTGRDVPADTYALLQTPARLPVCYESLSDGTTTTHLGKRSRLTVGSTAVYSFAPTNTGWYRIMAPIGGPVGMVSGKLTIRSYYREGAEIEVNVNPYAGSGNILLNVVRSSKYTATWPPLVTKARAFYYDASSEGYHNGWAGIDVLVTNVITTAHEMSKRLVFTLPLEGADDIEIGVQQLLAPTEPVDSNSGDTNGLPAGAYYAVTNVVRWP